MASSNNNYKAPPRKTDEITYVNWKKEVALWSFNTKCEKVKQGTALYLSLEGKPRETVLAEVPLDEITCDDGIKNIFKCLDKYYKKDETKSAFTAFDEFIKFRRDPKTSLKDYLIDFNLKYHRIENFDMKLPDGVLAYLLLTCANISPEKMEICRATCPTLTYDKMRETIEKVGVDSFDANSDKRLTFSTSGHTSNESSFAAPHTPVQIKQEPVYIAENCLQDFEDDQFDEYIEHEEVFYGNNTRPRRFIRYPSNQSNARYNNNNQKVFVKREKHSSSPKMNPIDSDGNVMTCKFCNSFYHFVEVCPDCPEHLKRKLLSKSSNRSFGSSQSKFI